MLKVWNCTQFSSIEFRKLDIYSNSNFNTPWRVSRKAFFICNIWLCSKFFFETAFLAVDIECRFVQNDWIDLIVSCLLVCNGNRLESF
jgi:hypothetical protein